MFTPLATALTDRQRIAEKTMEFILQRPTGFDYQAGQHVLLKLTELLFDDKKGPQRTLTLASAPHEESLRLATRMTGSGFKRTVFEGANQKVEIIGPRGNLTRDATRPAVFIAGGIGITPFRSMVLDAAYRQLEQPMTLFYSNQNLARAAFHELFVEIQQKHADIFTYIPTLTSESSGSNWDGERRSLSAAFIEEYVMDWSTSTFYICGPPAMVTAVHEILKSKNVSQEHILSESFWGYEA
ncbi:FAD-dependent oxidoreductase [candidate division KSB1 bacterium]|nr:FAD-dependent oxidoreductase [candidate division KSB1 bacterium]RQW05129.1 MAG: FAD-dependent oxidoreductase [candidate division KSB1 bacterium]